MNEEKIKKLYPFQYYTFKNVSVIKPYLTKYMFKTEHENELYIGNINGLLTMGEMLPIKMLNYFKANRKATFILPENYKETIDGLNGFSEQILKIIDFFSKQISIFTYKTDNSDIMNKIKETDMTFDVAIMNPPYDGSLHLKILEEVIKHSNIVTNISPIRWLQDPLAKYKKNSDYIKYEENISKKIDSLELIEKSKAFNIFNANFVGDLAIIYVNKGTFNYKQFNNNGIIDKVIINKCKKLIDVLEINKKDGWRVRISEMRPVPAFAPNSNVAKTTTFETTHYIHSWIYYNGYTPNGKIYWTDNNTTKGSRDKSKFGDNIPMSLSFASENEAINYEKSTKTKFHRYLVLKMKTDAHFPLKYIPYMGDYSKPWDDKRFCEYFGITGYIDNEHAVPNSEWETILNTMKPFL